MKGIHLFTFAAVSLAGCGSVPMTAAEFRDGIKKSSLGKVETFEVKRPVSEVGRTFQRKAAECLNFKLTSTQTPTNTSTPQLFIIVTPTNNPTNDPGSVWISAITATQFTINVRNDPGVGGATFAWQLNVS